MDTQLITRINNIPIKTVENANSLVQWNLHGKCNVSGMIDEKYVEEFRRLFQTNESIQIYMKNRDGVETIYFSGFLYSGEIEKNINGHSFFIEIASITLKMDRIEKKRVFQDKRITYRCLIETILEEYKYKIISGMDLDKEIGEIIVQYHETDWEFIKRVCSQLGFSVFGEFLSIEKAIHIGEMNVSRSELECQDGSMKRLSENEMDADFEKLIPEEYIIYECKSRKKCIFGSQIFFKNSLWYIKEQKSTQIRGDIVFTYTLCRKNILHRRLCSNWALVGIALDAKIKDVKNDSVQVEFDEGDMSKSDNLAWLPFSTVYSSPDGTGWYCMPEKGDKVRVFFPTENEKDAYVISAVHQPGGPGRSDPDRKSISNKYGKIVELAPSSIKVSNGAGMLLSISDENGIVITSDSDISLNANGNISLISNSDTIDICAAKSITLQQGDNKILVQDEIVMEGTRFKIQ